jgi:hypothetical protein
MNDWIPSLVDITQMCTSIQWKADKYSLDKQENPSSAVLLTKLNFLLNCSELPDLLVEYVTVTHQLIAARLELANGAISNGSLNSDPPESDQISPRPSEHNNVVSTIIDTSASEET